MTTFSISEALTIAVQHHQAGRLQAAEQLYRQVLAIDPQQVDALHLLGVIAHQAGRHEMAVELIRAAIRLNASVPTFHNNLGNALKDLGQYAEAMACYSRVVQLNPQFSQAHYNMGVVLQVQGRLMDAIACYRQAVKLNPDLAEAHNNLGECLKDAGQISEAIDCYRRAVSVNPEFREAHSNLVYALLFCPEYDGPAIAEAARGWNRQHAERLSQFIAPHANDRSPDRRLRVGYVSPNFRQHSESYFTVPLLAAHDHHEFEIFCYADGTATDGITGRLQSHADVWRDVSGCTDEQIAELVRQDQIDILVDLTMHMARNHLLVFARKPAPVQVCWLAYQGTTGLSTIDYRLTDPHLDPQGLFDDHYSETSVRLPESFWCYDPLVTEPPVNFLPALEHGYITFGSLNNFCKVNDSVLHLWARVLSAVPQSQLILLAAEGVPHQHALQVLAQRGVAPDRVTFVSRQPRREYLEVYHRIDMGLDTFPYNGQTTTLDSLSMGVPVVTLAGSSSARRAGLSLLTNIGLPELVAVTHEQFVGIAAELARDLPRLSSLRASLRNRLQTSPLMDAPRFARNMEAAYRRMWHAWCARKLKTEN